MGSAHSQFDTVEKWIWSWPFRERSLRKYFFFTPDHRSHVWKNNIYGNRDLIKFQFETQIWILDMVRWWIWWWWECKNFQKKGKSETDVKTVRVSFYAPEFLMSVDVRSPPKKAEIKGGRAQGREKPTTKTNCTMNVYIRLYLFIFSCVFYSFIKYSSH